MTTSSSVNENIKRLPLVFNQEFVKRNRTKKAKNLTPKLAKDFFKSSLERNTFPPIILLKNTYLQALQEKERKDNLRVKPEELLKNLSLFEKDQLVFNFTTLNFTSNNLFSFEIKGAKKLNQLFFGYTVFSHIVRIPTDKGNFDYYLLIDKFNDLIIEKNINKFTTDATNEVVAYSNAIDSNKIDTLYQQFLSGKDIVTLEDYERNPKKLKGAKKTKTKIDTSIADTVTVKIKKYKNKKIKSVESHNAETTTTPTTISTLTKENYPHNWIISGAPGTGKSYIFKQLEESHPSAKFSRITFFPNLQYANFIGAFKPNNNANKQLVYTYTPGILLETLVQALLNPQQDYVLIIEELNRANAAGVFGDYFQLLDRSQEGNSEYPIALSNETIDYLDQELSKEENIQAYQNLFLRHPELFEERALVIDPNKEVNPEQDATVKTKQGKKKKQNKSSPSTTEQELQIAKEIKDFHVQLVELAQQNNMQEAQSLFNNFKQQLVEKGVSIAATDFPSNLKEFFPFVLDQIIFPRNFYLWATMNNADQGVLPLDTAFKRRWYFTYLGLRRENNTLDTIHESFNSDEQQELTKEHQQLNWDAYRKAINKLLLDFHIPEDKLLGRYFLHPQTSRNPQALFYAIRDKVLQYLYEDAVRSIRSRFFSASYRTFAQLREAFSQDPYSIFNDPQGHFVNLKK